MSADRDPGTGPEPGPGPDDALASRLRRTELQRAASSVPGRDIIQVLTEIPVGVESGWHTHPGERRRTTRSTSAPGSA